MSAETYTDEILMAFADGELDNEQAERVAEAVANDAELRRRVEMFEASRDIVGAALGPLSAMPVPEALERAARGETAANVVQLPVRAKPSPAPLRSWALPMAASLALIVGVGGGFVAGQRVGGGEGTTSLALGAALSERLATQPSGSVSTDGNEALRVLASFRDDAGTFCREFVQTSPSESTTAIACLDDDAWQLRFVITGSSVDDSGFVTASAVGALEAYLADIGASAPLTEEEEANLLRAAP